MRTIALASLFFIYSAAGATPSGKRANKVRHDAAHPAADANPNTQPAGTLRNGVLRVSLEARPAMWAPEGPNSPLVPVFAFAESGKRASVPGPLIRVPAGTRIRAAIRNSLPRMMRVRGFEDRASAILDTLDIEPGQVREIDFQANTAGTYYYWGRTEGTREERATGEDSQLVGAFIVDPAGSKPEKNERVMLITLFDDTLRTIPKPDEKEVLAINGMSWPYTERLGYTVGDTITWRVINFSVAPHPMHLHGFYFDVLRKGDAARDTVFSQRMIRKAVTESMFSGNTMTMRWVPTRPGNWLFHCHLIFHIDAALKLAEPHAMHSVKPNHAEEGMSGLVMGIFVSPKSGKGIPDEPVGVRKLRLFVNQREKVFGNKPGFSFVLQQGSTPPASDSVTIPSSAVILHKGEPTEITVINHTSQMAGVHWHGIELNSYYDGVGDWSGWRKKTAPIIAPGDSFVVKMTPDRSGTFIYHTHVDETVQLTSGLYGALIVLDSGTSRDTTERIFLMGDGGPGNQAPAFVNGSTTPPPVGMSANTPYRFRLINISAGGTQRVRLMKDSSVVLWRPLAKDGATLPPIQSTLRPGVFTMMPGETYDVEVQSSAPQDLTLLIESRYRRRSYITPVPLLIR